MKKFTVKVPHDGSQINMHCVDFKLIINSTNEWFSPIIEHGVPVEPSSVIILLDNDGYHLSINSKDIDDFSIAPCD